MPHKGDAWRWVDICAGAADFVLDDLHITKHARQRLVERRLPVECARLPVHGGKPIIIGSTVVTVIGGPRRPATVSGELWQPSVRTGAPRAPGPRLFAEVPQGRARGPAHRSMAAKLAASKTLVKHHVVVVPCAGFEGRVIGMGGKTIRDIGERWGVTLNVHDGVVDIHSDARNAADADAAANEVRAIVESQRAAQEKRRGTAAASSAAASAATAAGSHLAASDLGAPPTGGLATARMAELVHA